jgi:mycothiol synthase
VCRVPAISIDVLTWIGPDQVAAVVQLCERADQADGVHPLSEHVLLHLRHGGEGPDRHLIARSDAGDTVGYAHLDPTDPVAGPAVELVVDPRHRGQGIGRLLVKAAIDETPDGRLRLWAHGLHPAAAALATSMGFTQGRRLEQWRRSLSAELPDVDLPPGVRLRTFRPGSDDAAWLELNARAFAGHPEQGSWTAGDLQARLAESWFDPEGFLIAEDVGQHHSDGHPQQAVAPRMIGFHWTKVHGATTHGSGQDRHDHPPLGEVYVVGVDPSQQGRGLGRALTLAGLHRLRRQGLTQAMLYVEHDNAAAQAVYRALGFRHWDTDVMFYRTR